MEDNERGRARQNRLGRGAVPAAGRPIQGREKTACRETSLSILHGRPDTGRVLFAKIDEKCPGAFFSLAWAVRV